MNATEIIGKEVLDKDVNRIGKVVDIVLNIEKGMIEYYLVKIGLTKKIFITNSSIARVGEKIILNVTKEEAEKSPTATRK